MLKLNKEQALRLLSAPANSFQIMGHKMSLNYSRNNMWLFMDVLEVFSEVRVVATCTVGCPVLMEGTVELDPVAWGWWPQHLIMCLQQTWGPSYSGVLQMELLHIHCCPTGAAPLRLLFGVFFVAFVAHCKTAVGGGGWIAGLTPCCDLAVSVESCLMFHPQASLFHFTMGTNVPPTKTSQILNWKPVIHAKLWVPSQHNW